MKKTDAHSISTDQMTSRSGAILFSMVVLVSLIALAAVTLVGVNIADLKSAGYSIQAQKAFYQAEGGARYVINCINQALQTGAISLHPESTSSVIAVSYAAPSSDYNFDPVYEILKVNNDRWMYTVTGHYGNAKAVIEVTVRRPRLFTDIGIFGQSVDLKSNTEIYSYRSDEMEASPTNSTGEANIGYNLAIALQTGGAAAVYLDGRFMIGKRPDGTYVIVAGGYEYTLLPEAINPDPLGATNGTLAGAFVTYATNNNNAAVPAIVANNLNVTPGNTVNMPGGKYYLEDIYLGNNSTLNMQGTPDDPVVIFLRGSFTAMPNHNVTTTNGPAATYIFSDTTEDIIFMPNQDFNGFIYAPYANELYVLPNGDLKGVFWSKIVKLWPNAVVFIDVSLLDKFLAGQVEIVQWRRLL